MGRLVTGISLILFLIVAGVVIALANGQEATGNGLAACETDGQNATDCQAEAQSSGSFIDTIRNVEIFSFGDGTPTEIVVLWAIIAATLLTAAILLIVLAFVPLTSE